MSKIVVNYFQIRARGEPIRMVLRAAGVDFEDHRVSFADWPSVKPTTPAGVLPYVKMPDGKILTESLAIARYLALEHGFMGNGNFDVYLIERALGTYSDLLDPALQVHFAPDAEKAKKKEVSRLIRINQNEVSLWDFCEKTISKINSYQVFAEVSITDYT